MNDDRNTIWSLIDKHHQRLLAEWLACQERDMRLPDADRKADTAGLARRFLEELRRGAGSAQFDDIHATEWQPMRELLEDLSRDRAVQGFSPNETAIFVFSLKEPLFALLRRELGKDADRLASETWIASRLIDKLGLYTIGVLRENPRGGDHPPATGIAGTVYSCGRTVGRHPGAAAYRHAR